MSLPEELKPIRSFLLEAKKVQKIQPLIAHQARLHAVSLGLGIEPRTPTVTKFIAMLMDQLESVPDEIKSAEKIDAKKAVARFALTVFAHADNEDRAGNASKRTVAAFRTAYIFIEVLKQYGDLDELFVDKRKYAMWKMADISRALREGRTPHPGPPGWSQEEEDAALERELDGIQAPSPEPSSEQGDEKFAELGPQSSIHISPADVFNQMPTQIPPSHSPSAPAPVQQPNPPANPPVNPSSHTQPPKTKEEAFPRFPSAPQPQAQQSSPTNSQSFDQQAAMIGVMSDCEKLTKHALGAMRFTDADTTIDKLLAVVDQLRPFSAKHKHRR